MFSRSFKNINKRHFSCRYTYDKPFVSPFMASLICGSLFTSFILSRMHSNDTQLMIKLYEMEKDIKNIKDIKDIKDKSK